MIEAKGGVTLLAGRDAPGSSFRRLLCKERPMTKHAVTVADLKRAIEARDGKTLAGFYADDAVMRIIDRNNPPSNPREVRGKAAIAAFHDDVCSRAMTHKVETGVSDGDHLAFSQSCAYPDGIKVLCSAMLELKGGKIARQTVVQAWDE
jgi:hypothetical protein